MRLYRALVIVYYVFSLSLEVKPDGICSWDIQNCFHEEISCSENQYVYLDAKESKADRRDHCFAVNDGYQGEFKNYEMSVEMLSLKSSEGPNSGTIGLMFNYQDPMNYDFVSLV